MCSPNICNSLPETALTPPSNVHSKRLLSILLLIFNFTFLTIHSHIQYHIPLLLFIQWLLIHSMTPYHFNCTVLHCVLSCNIMHGSAKHKQVETRKEHLANEKEIRLPYLAWFSRSLASARRWADRWTIAASYRAHGTRYWSSSISFSLAHNRTITNFNQQMPKIPSQLK